MRFNVIYSFSFDLEKIVYAHSDKSMFSKFIEWQKRGKGSGFDILKEMEWIKLYE